MNIILKIKAYIQRKWILRDSNSYICWMKSQGVSIGNNFKIAANGPLSNITIDMTRPSLISIGNNVTINKNFTLVTHDFVSGVFIKKYNDFLPSSGKVTIGNNVRFGANCTILKGITIGDNCFIAAGSVISSDIPANSIAGGNPCKVIIDMDSFYKYRQTACREEAYLYAQSIVKTFGRQPNPSDFWEEFPLFVNKDNIDKYPKIPIRRQLGEAYDFWIENHESVFQTFEEFIKYALEYVPVKQEITQENRIKIPKEEIERVRNIVSECTESHLTSKDDMLNMNDVDGWSSLANMMILQKIEQTFNISIPLEEFIKMTSIYAIAEIVNRYSKKNESKQIKFENVTDLYPHSPLLNTICKHVEEVPQKPAVKISGQIISYAKLYENICKTASALYHLGLRHGNRIILSAHKEIEFIYIYFASHILGLTNVIVDAESNAERLTYIENKIQPKYCFGYISSSYPSKRFTDLEIIDQTIMQISPENTLFSEQDIAEILFTTGTTGNPKGVCLTFGNIYGSASNINEYIQNTSEDIELLGLPICHSFGMGRIRCNLLKGATIVILGSFANVQNVFKTIEKEKITGFGIVPAVWAYIRKISGKTIGKYAEQIKYIEIGSAAMPIETKKELLEIFPNTHICMHYGLTEASRACFMNFHDEQHLDSIGKAVCNKVEVKIFNQIGKELAYNEKGEICVKGNMVMKTYLDDKDSANAFYGDFFRTGDYGYVSKDGYIYLIGREKELINVGGKKVSPMEVEDIICAMGVTDCICVPMKDPKGVMGELVKCYILKNGTELTFEQIAKNLSGKIEQYKRPAVYEWIDKIPYTESGKKQRLNLIVK